MNAVITLVNSINCFTLTFSLKETVYNFTVSKLLAGFEYTYKLSTSVVFTFSICSIFLPLFFVAR